VTIAIIAIGRLDSAVFKEAERSAHDLFGCETRCCGPLDIPSGSFDARRKQHSSVAFMLALSRGGFEDFERVIGITEADLFIPMLTFVFGQAQFHGRVALVSVARLRPEFYGSLPDPDLLALRLKKEIGHELGHSLGLIHCPDRECLMSLATGIQEVDRKAAGFCWSCGSRVSGAKEISNEIKVADFGRR
jgi:archaemetzincin